MPLKCPSENLTSLLIMQERVKPEATALKALVKEAEHDAAALTTFLGSPGADPAAVIAALSRFAQSWDQALAHMRRWYEAEQRQHTSRS
jgi:hypothetical protein